jgi:hypothetical protein
MVKHVKEVEKDLINIQKERNLEKLDLQRFSKKKFSNQYEKLN